MFALPVAKNELAKLEHSSVMPRFKKHERCTQNPAMNSLGTEGRSEMPSPHPHWSFAKTPVLARDSDQQFPIQTKLRVAPDNDPLEKEANSLADQLVGSAKPNLEESSLNAQSPPLSAHSSVDQVLPTSGKPLDADIRGFMESRFGSDFSQVRVHTDSVAARTADDVDAVAYTVGRNIVFSANQYKPGTAEGRRLLAHELTHVVQQNGSTINTSKQVTGHANSGTIQREPRNSLDDTAKKIIEAAKDTSKSIDQRAIDAVNDIVKTYYDPSMVDSVVYNEDEVGLVTTPVGKSKDIKGKITVGKDFVNHIDAFARRVLQVGHELEHVKQQREGMGGHNKSHEREFLAFYWEATQPEKTGTGRMPHATRVSLIDEALRNYYCLPQDSQEKYASKKDELLTLRSSEEHKGGNDHTEPPTSCPSGK